MTVENKQGIFLDKKYGMLSYKQSYATKMVKSESFYFTVVGVVSGW